MKRRKRKGEKNKKNLSTPAYWWIWLKGTAFTDMDLLLMTQSKRSMKQTLTMCVLPSVCCQVTIRVMILQLRPLSQTKPTLVSICRGHSWQFKRIYKLRNCSPSWSNDEWMNVSAPVKINDSYFNFLCWLLMLSRWLMTKNLTGHIQWIPLLFELVRRLASSVSSVGNRQLLSWKCKT